jgi:Sec-independent protein translocase protein TatA
VFGIGPQEVLIIGFLVLLVIGPRKFLDVTKDMGRFVSEARTYTDTLKDELTSEEVSEARREAKKIKDELSEEVHGVRREAQKFKSELVASGENQDGPADGPPTGGKQQVGEQREPPSEDRSSQGPTQTEPGLAGETGGEPAEEPHPEKRDQAREQRQEAGEEADDPSRKRTQSEQHRGDFDGFGSGGSMVDTRRGRSGLRRILSRKR